MGSGPSQPTYLSVNSSEPVNCARCQDGLATYAGSWKNQVTDIIKDGHRAPKMLPQLLPFWLSGGETFQQPNLYTACNTCVKEKSISEILVRKKAGNWCVNDMKILPPINLSYLGRHSPRQYLHVKELVARCQHTPPDPHECTADMCGTYISTTGHTVRMEYYKIPNACRTVVVKDGHPRYYWRCCGSKAGHHPKPYCY